MKILLLYFFALGFIAIRDFFRVRNFDDYVVAGRKQATPFVFMSLMATILGASATVGIAAKTGSIGFAAFWWLGVGAIGFWFQAAFLSKRIHDLDVRTLPELAEKTVGSIGRKLVAIIIAISWIGIIAAQFAAVAGFVALILGNDGGSVSIVVTAAIVTIYTLIGGQYSVVRTDALQFWILAIGFIACFIYLLGGFSGTETANPSAHVGAIVLLNENFSFADLCLMLFTVGGAYFLGPDVISRNLIAKDSRSAKNAVIIASFVTLIFSVVIVYLGMWANTFVPGTGNPLFRLASGELPLPLPLAALLSMGLLSALLSSADTCLINAAAIFGSDILNSRKISTVRIIVVVIGAIAMYLALGGKDIISLLTMAYSVYTPGIVAPLAVAIISSKKHNIHKPTWYASVCVGGLFGLVPAIGASAGADFAKDLPDYVPHIGIALSLAIALASLRKKAPELQKKA